MNAPANIEAPTAPKPATLDAIRFLKPWPTPPTLTAIYVDSETGAKGRIETKAFPPGPDGVSWSSVFNWINERNGRANLYFLVNEAREPKDKKALKEEISRGVALHVDVDVRVGEDQREGIDRIVKTMQAYNPPPSVIISSGGGAQAFWLLNKPVPIADDAAAGDFELRNVQLARALEGDKCQNIDRIMRLPGTINIPDKKKRDKGRKTALATVVESNVDRRYDLEQLKQAAPTTREESPRVNGATLQPSRAVTVGPEAPVTSLDDPRLANLRDRAKQIMQHGKVDGEDPKEGKDTSRSGWLYDFSCECIRCGMQDALIAAIITDPRWKISASVLDKKDRDREVNRVITRAHKVARHAPHFIDFTEAGNIRSSYRNNRESILALKFRCRYDVFHDRLLIEPTEGIAHQINVPIGEVSDPVLARLRQIICDVWNYDPGKEQLHDAVVGLCLENRFDPVADYLTECQGKWDGTPRLDTMAVTYFKAEDTPLNRTMMAKHMIAGVERVRIPGSKHDEILTLESPEGFDKSSAIEVLHGAENFSDQTILGKSDREAQESMTGIWGYEIADLSGMERTEVERNKSFASRKTDRARPAYGRVREDRPRRCIFWATTNDFEYLKSQTGNRRWWTLAVGRCDIAALKRDRDQIWGEAAARQAAGETSRLDPTLWAIAGEAQEARRERDPWEDLLAGATGKIEDNEERIFSGDILTSVLKLEAGHIHPAHGKRLARTMLRLGWYRHPHRKVTIGKVQASGFFRPVMKGAGRTTGGTDDLPF